MAAKVSQQKQLTVKLTQHTYTAAVPVAGAGFF